MTEQAVTFHGPDSTILSGILTTADHRAEGQKHQTLPAQRCALLCHGFASHKDGFHFPKLAAFLAKDFGISCLRFDFTGNMDSPGEFRFGGLMQEVEQIASAKKYLEEQHGFKVVLLLGHSRGAINSTLYSGKYGDIPLVVLVAGRFDLTLNMKQRYGADVLQRLEEGGPQRHVTQRDGDRTPLEFTLTAEEMRERFDLDMPATCKAVSHHPLPPAVLVVHGDADPICESSDAAALADNIASAQLCVISGANHWFTGCFEPLTAAIKGFTVRHWLEQGIGTCNPATNFVQR